MTNSRGHPPQDDLANFRDRHFEGICGHATATVDGAPSLLAVQVDGPFHQNTSACIRKAINYALITAREALGRYLARDSGLDLPTTVREVLDGASAPTKSNDGRHRDYVAKRAGVLVKIDAAKCLVTWIDVPSPQHLMLLPDVVNAAITAAEAGGDAPPLAELFDSTWSEITGGLDELEERLDAILAEHHDDNAC